MKATKWLRLAWLGALVVGISLPACDKNKGDKDETKKKDNDEESEEEEDSESEEVADIDTTTTTKNFKPCKTAAVCAGNPCCVANGFAYCSTTKGCRGGESYACTATSQCSAGDTCGASGVPGVKRCIEGSPGENCATASDCSGGKACCEISAGVKLCMASCPNKPDDKGKGDDKGKDDDKPAAGTECKVNADCARKPGHLHRCQNGFCKYNKLKLNLPKSK